MRSQPGIFESGRPPSEPFSFLKRATRFSISLREMPRRGRVSWKFKDAPTSESLEIVDDSLGYSLLAFGKSIDGPREIRHERIEVAEAVLRGARNEYGIFELRLIAPREGLPVEDLLRVPLEHANVHDQPGLVVGSHRSGSDVARRAVPDIEDRISRRGDVRIIVCSILCLGRFVPQILHFQTGSGEVPLEVISHHACKSQLAAIVFPEEFRRLLLLYRAGYRPAYQPAERGQARKGANHEA